MQLSEPRAHCPKCSSYALWDVRSQGELMGMQCQDCGFVFKQEEAVVGVDLDV